jgi:hypothetical protein
VDRTGEAGVADDLQIIEGGPAEDGPAEEDTAEEDTTEEGTAGEDIAERGHADGATVRAIFSGAGSPARSRLAATLRRANAPGPGDAVVRMATVAAGATGRVPVTGGVGGTHRAPAAPVERRSVAGAPVDPTRGGTSCPETVAGAAVMSRRDGDAAVACRPAGIAVEDARRAGPPSCRRSSRRFTDRRSSTADAIADGGNGSRDTTGRVPGARTAVAGVAPRSAA